MFEQTALTFKTGCSGAGDDPESFTDVREIQRMPGEQGLELAQRTAPYSTAFAIRRAK